MRYLGRKSELAQALRDVRDRETGMLLNPIRERLEAEVEARRQALERAELDRRLREERVDVTLPGDERRIGSLHPTHRSAGSSRTRSSASATTSSTTARSRPRTTTSTSSRFRRRIRPVRRATPSSSTRGVCSGPRPRRRRSTRWRRRSRRSTWSRSAAFTAATGHATRFPIFHQFEGLAVDRGITLTDLKGTLLHVMRVLFGDDREVRFRTHYFPFTEPSIEPDVSCPNCNFEGCRMCKFTGWIELGGAGMVDPQVFENVGIDPEEWSGFAFGCGLERVGPAPLRHHRDPPVLGKRPPRPRGSSRHEDPAQLAARVRPTGAAARRARLAHRRLHRRGGERRADRRPRRRREPRALPRRATCSRRASIRTPTGSSSAAWTWAKGSRARSCAAPGTSAPARPSRSRFPGRCCRAGTKLERAKLRGAGLRRDDPLRARARARRRPQRNPRSPRAASRARRSPTSLPLGETVIELRGDEQPRRSPLGLRRGARRRRAARRRPRAAAGQRSGAGRRRTGGRPRSRIWRAARATSAASSATSRSARRLPGCARGSRRPGCARSRTSST